MMTGLTKHKDERLKGQLSPLIVDSSSDVGSGRLDPSTVPIIFLFLRRGVEWCPG